MAEIIELVRRAEPCIPRGRRRRCSAPRVSGARAGGFLDGGGEGAVVAGFGGQAPDGAGRVEAPGQFAGPLGGLDPDDASSPGSGLSTVARSSSETVADMQVSANGSAVGQPAAEAPPANAASWRRVVVDSGASWIRGAVYSRRHSQARMIPVFPVPSAPRLRKAARSAQSVPDTRVVHIRPAQPRLHTLY